VTHAACSLLVIDTTYISLGSFICVSNADRFAISFFLAMQGEHFESFNCGACNPRNKKMAGLWGTEEMFSCNRCELTFHVRCCDPPVQNSAIDCYDYLCSDCLERYPNMANIELTGGSPNVEVVGGLSVGDERLFTEDGQAYVVEVLACQTRRLAVNTRIVPAYRLTFKGWGTQWDQWVGIDDTALAMHSGASGSRMIAKIKHSIDHIRPLFNIGSRVWDNRQDTVVEVTDVAILMAEDTLLEEAMYCVVGGDGWARENFFIGPLIGGRGDQRKGEYYFVKGGGKLQSLG
jgi:hypothetical protein